MTAHLISGQIAGYLARTLPPAEVLSLHSHLETCLDCRHALEEASLSRLPSASLPLLCDTVDPHLTEEEMVAFIGRRLPEPRLAEVVRHLAACQICQDSVAAMESVGTQPARRVR
jgi:hypothetical protein